MQALPKGLEDDVRCILVEPTWDLLWARVERREEQLISKRGNLPEPLATFQATNPLFDVEMEEPPTFNRVVGKREPGKCSCCGQPGHFKKDCPRRNFRCFKCGVIGHLSNKCPNLALKDAKGRVDTRVQPKESSIIMTQRRDRSQQDKMVSAEAAVSALRDIAIRRSQTAATRRQKKKAESGWVRRRPIVEHPEGIVEEKSGVVDSKEGSSSDSELDEMGYVNELEKALQAL